MNNLVLVIPSSCANCGGIQCENCDFARSIILFNALKTRKLSTKSGKIIYIITFNTCT